MKNFLSTFVPVTRNVVVGLRWKAIFTLISIASWCTAFGFAIAKLKVVGNNRCTLITEDGTLYQYYDDAAYFYHIWSSMIFMFGLMLFSFVMSFINRNTPSTVGRRGWNAFAVVFLMGMIFGCFFGINFYSPQQFSCVIEPTWAKVTFGFFVLSSVPVLLVLAGIAVAPVGGLFWGLYKLCVILAKPKTWSQFGSFLFETFVVTKVETIGWVEAPVQMTDLETGAAADAVEAVGKKDTDAESVRTMINET